jgi:hypothetical protein
LWERHIVSISELVHWQLLIFHVLLPECICFSLRLVLVDVTNANHVTKCLSHSIITLANQAYAIFAHLYEIPGRVHLATCVSFSSCRLETQ